MNLSGSNDYPMDMYYDGSGFDHRQDYGDVYDDDVGDNIEVSLDSSSDADTDVDAILYDNTGPSDIDSQPGFYPTLYLLYEGRELSDNGNFRPAEALTEDRQTFATRSLNLTDEPSGVTALSSVHGSDPVGYDSSDDVADDSATLDPLRRGPANVGVSEPFGVIASSVVQGSDSIGVGNGDSEDVGSEDVGSEDVGLEDVGLEDVGLNEPPSVTAPIELSNTNPTRNETDTEASSAADPQTLPTAPQIATANSAQDSTSITSVASDDCRGGNNIDAISPATPPEVQVQVVIATKHGLVHDWVDHGRLSEHLYSRTAPTMPGHQSATSTLTCVDDYVSEDVTRTWLTYPGNQPPLETDKPTFWTRERRRKRKYLVEGIETIKNAYRNPVAPYIRNVPFALAVPVIACAIVRANHSSYREEIQALTSETLPGYVDGQKVATEWPTVGQTRGLDTIDPHLLQRANYYNGRIFFTCHSDLYLHRSHQYLGLCRAKSAQGAVTSSYLLSGYNYHSLLPRKVFTAVDDYLKQYTDRVNPTVAPTKRMVYWRAAVSKYRQRAHRRRIAASHTYIGLYADAPLKLDAVYSPYTVPNLRRLLPSAIGDDFLLIPCQKPPRYWFDIRRLGALRRENLRRIDPCRWTLRQLGLRRQRRHSSDPWDRNHLTLWPDPRRRLGQRRIKFHLRWHQQDRATRLEQLGRVTHQALCDGLPRVGSRRSAHYHLYNHVLKWRQFMGQMRNETTYPELFSWPGFLEYPQRRLNRYEQWRRDRHLVDITIEEMQDFGGHILEDWDNTGRPVYALEVDSPSHRRTYLRRQRALGEAIHRAHHDVRGLSTMAEQYLMEWPRLIHDDDTETSFELQWRFWDRYYMHGSIRKVLRASNGDARLYGLCHRPWSDGSRRRRRGAPIASHRSRRLRRGIILAQSDQLRRLSSGVGFPDTDEPRLRTLLVGWRDPGTAAETSDWCAHAVNFEIHGAPRELARNYIRSLSSPDWWSGFVAGHQPTMTDDALKDGLNYGEPKDDFGWAIAYDGPTEAREKHYGLSEEDYDPVDADAEDQRLNEPHYDERGSRQRRLVVGEHWGPTSGGGLDLTSGVPHRGHGSPYKTPVLGHEGHLAGSTYGNPAVSYTHAIFDHLKGQDRNDQLRWFGRPRENPLIDGYRWRRRRVGDVRRLRLGQLNWMLDAARKESRAEVKELLGRRDVRLENELTQHNFIERLIEESELDVADDTPEPGIPRFGELDYIDPDAFKVVPSIDDEDQLEDDSQIEYVDYHSVNLYEEMESEEFDFTQPNDDPYDPDTSVWQHRHVPRTGDRLPPRGLHRDRRLFNLAPAPKMRDDLWRGRVSDSPVACGAVHHEDHVRSNYWVRLNRRDVLSEFETSARVPWWVSAYQLYLFSRLIRVADRFQDRYALAIFIFIHDLFHEFKVGSFRHLTAQNDLVVSPRHRQGFRELVGSGELLGEFGPTIRYLQASRLGWMPLGIHRPRADYHGQASGRSTATLHGAAPRGILLVGPPGTGKTHLIKALAAESAVEAIVYGRERYYARVSLGPRGEFGPALQVVNLFDIARQESPCLVFIDEIDGLGPDRRHVVSDDGVSLSGGHLLTRRRDFVKLNAFDQWLERTAHAHPSFNLIKTTSWHWRVTNPTLYNEVYTVKAPRAVKRTKMPSLNTRDETPGFENPPLSQVAMLTLGHLLTHIDGFDVQSNVVVGATNRPRALDPALVRPGRLNKIVFLDLPSRQRRFDLLTFLSIDPTTGSSRNAEPIDWDYFSRRSSGLSPAHLRAALNFSILRSAYRMVQSGTLEDDGTKALHDRESVRYGLRNVEARNSVVGWQRQLRHRLGRVVYAYGTYYQGAANGYALLTHALAESQLAALQAYRCAAVIDNGGTVTWIKPKTDNDDVEAYGTRTLGQRPHGNGATVMGLGAPVGRSAEAAPPTQTELGVPSVAVDLEPTAIFIRSDYFWDFVRSRETQKRLRDGRPDYVKERERRTLIVQRELRRNVTGRTHYASKPDERAWTTALREELYERIGKHVRRAYLWQTVDERGPEVDHLDVIGRVTHADEDTVELLGQVADFSRRTLKHHLFGTTLLRHSSFATSELVSPHRNPYYGVRGKQLIRSRVHMSRYGMSCVLMGHLTHRRDRTILPVGQRARHAQKPLLEDDHGLQRIAYHTAARALVRARLGIPDDEERMYRLWEPLRNQEMPPDERTFVQATLKRCFTRREFTDTLATLMSGRVGEQAYLHKFGAPQSDLGRQELKQAGWLVNIMIENNLFVRSDFAFLKQNALEGLQVRRNRMEGVKKARRAGLQEEQMDRRNRYQINRYLIDRSAVHQPRQGAEAEAEFWWSDDLVRRRHRKEGASYTRYYESAEEVRRWPWVENLYNLNAGVDRAALRTVNRQVRGGAYDALVTQFLTEMRAGSNQQLLSASDGARVQLMFEVYDQLVHFFNGQRSIYDHLVFQLMTRDELDETQTSRQFSQLMIVKKLGNAVCRELKNHEQLMGTGEVVDTSIKVEPSGADVSLPPILGDSLSGQSDGEAALLPDDALAMFSDGEAGQSDGEAGQSDGT